MRRAQIDGWLDSGGRPQRTKTVVDIIVRLKKGGMSEPLAMTLGAYISDVSNGFDWKLRDGSDILERAIRQEHAEKFPNGKWAILQRRYGPRALYMDDNSPEARAWSTGDEGRVTECPECGAQTLPAERAQEFGS